MFRILRNQLNTTAGTRGGASVPRGTAHYLYTYHITFVRTINRNQSEPIRTSPKHSVFILIHQSSIRIKIRANHSDNFRFKCTCTYRNNFDSNENPFRNVPNRFRSDSHARTKQFFIRMKIRAQSNYRTIFDSNENQSIGCYVVITYITQIGVVRNHQASRNQRACSTQL